jgi:hypothetical protein
VITNCHDDRLFMRHRNEDVVFRLSNLTLENVPFSSKKVSVRFQRYVTDLLSTRPADVDESGHVHWPDPAPFQDHLSRAVDTGRFLTRTVNVFVSVHDSQRGSRQDTMAGGKLDLAQLANDGSGPVAFPLQSELLLSPFRFDAEVLVGNVRAERVQKPAVNREKLPEITPVLLTGTFRFKHSPKEIEADAYLLMAAAKQPKGGVE